MAGLPVNNKQKVRQAMVKIAREGGNHPLPLARYVSRNGLIGGFIVIAIKDSKIVNDPAQNTLIFCKTKHQTEQSFIGNTEQLDTTDYLQYLSVSLGHSSASLQEWL